MKVLVVGGSGFIGKALVSALIEAGHAVEVWDRIPLPEGPRLKSRVVDLLGAGDLPRPESRPWQAAFHLAAYSVPGMEWTQDLVMANLRMTARVFDHLAQVSPGCTAVLASSALVYAPSESPLAESARLGASHPYALSKRLSEAWALSRQDSLKVFIVRPFNLIGPGMAPGLLVPDLLDRIRSGETPILMRGRDDVRDFLDWRDAVEAYLRMLEADAPSGTIWNLCSGRPTRVSQLVKVLLQAHGRQVPVQFAVPACEYMVGDPASLIEATGWAPRRSLEETAAAIVAGP